MAFEFQYSAKNPSYPVSYLAMKAMHSRLEIVWTGSEEETARALAQRVEELVLGLEREFNRFSEKSPLAVVNLKAGRESVCLSEDLYMALELCEAFRRGTAGYFDIATSTSASQMGAVNYWLEAKNHSVRFAREGVQLDLGGFAKGFALERVSALLAKEGIDKALMNFGSSSILALGHHPYGECWSVGVEHLKQHGIVAHQVCLNDSAMSVSGRNHKGEYHIVNPLTGASVASDELILVEGRSALVCEVLSTALYAMPKSLRAKVISEYEGYRATEILCHEYGSVSINEIGKTENLE